MTERSDVLARDPAGDAGRRPGAPPGGTLLFSDGTADPVAQATVTYAPV